MSKATDVAEQSHFFAGTFARHDAWVPIFTRAIANPGQIPRPDLMNLVAGSRGVLELPIEPRTPDFDSSSVPPATYSGCTACGAGSVSFN